MIKKLIIAIGILLVAFLYFHGVVWAKANVSNSLILRDDGSIILLFESPVLGATTDKDDNESKKKTPETKHEPAPQNFVPVVAANQPATVTVNPKNEKQVTVTVSEPPKNSAGAPANPTKPASGSNVVNSTSVDKVVIEGKDNSVIMSIAPVSKNSVVIENQGTQAQTNLPLEIDSKTHAVRAKDSGGQKVNILLPDLVLQNLVNEGLAGQSGINNQKPVLTAMSLGLKGNDVVYTVVQQQKLFGNITLPPSVITVSNATGRTSAPLYSRLFGLLFFR